MRPKVETSLRPLMYGEKKHAKTERKKKQVTQEIEFSSRQPFCPKVKKKIPCSTFK
jgi:hypothetical protein